MNPLHLFLSRTRFALVLVLGLVALAFPVKGPLHREQD